MHLSKKWAALAVAHLVIVACLAAGVILIAWRLRPSGNVPVAFVAPAEFPSAVEIARLDLVSARIAIIQNNLANADTIAYKRQSANIEEGSSPKLSDCQLDLSQGPLEATGSSTDVAIEGEGFFRVKIPPTVSDGYAYTRNGTLKRGCNGQLRVAVGPGYELVPAITLPKGATNISIELDGTVNYTASGDSVVHTAGQLRLYQFTVAEALGRWEGLYIETSKSGPADCCLPGSNGAGLIQQGFLEQSNVDAVKEWAILQRAQSMLQFSSQTTGHKSGKQNLGTRPPEPA